MNPVPLTIAWLSHFPVEWLPDVPEHIRSLPREHPASWQRVLLAELQKYPELRLHIVVLRKHFERSESFERKGTTFHLLKTTAGLRAPTLFWSDTWRIARLLKSIKPDLVHAWGIEKGAGLIASRLGYPYVLTMHGLLSWLAELTRLDAYHQFTRFLERPSLRRASVVTVESAFGHRYLKERYPHLELHQIEHAPLQLFHEVTRKPQIAPVRMLFVGSFTQGKGADVMLRALDKFREQSDFEIIVAGGADVRFAARLKSEVSEELWAKIRFAGNLTSHDIARELEVATLMLYPTRCDNSPNAVKEAVVAGVPVVASAIGGIVDYVWPGQNGILFEPANCDACLKALWQWRNHAQLSRGQVDAAALNKAREYLSADRMGLQFSQLYCQIAQAERGNRARNAI